MIQIGTHLIIDLIKCTQNLNELDIIKQALNDAAVSIGATVLDINTHRFHPQGITGVALLAESHISIHTWPEFEYAAIDIFVCGKLDPSSAIELFKTVFQPTNINCKELKRGIE